MAKAYLQMKYHPAKKEVEFRRFENGCELAIRGGKLQHYMDQKGAFVLQDQGNQFFRDIARAFDSVQTLEIKVITTKNDYDDFEQMIEYYNEDPDRPCTITSKLMSELPDMTHTFREVKKYGKKAIGVLQKHQHKLRDGWNFENVQKAANNYAKQIATEIRSIEDKMTSMEDKKVNICFAGCYSTGKSALINAILGYKILPESENSKTAKMFLISSPKDKKTVKISFDIYNDRTVLEWNEEEKKLDFKEGPHENDERAEIQKKLNELEGEQKTQHEQIYTVLNNLNGMSAVGSQIEIEFPIPLDNDITQFTIYDTPGSDSNHIEHGETLKEVLGKQTQSILIFVVAPGRVEGSGNKVLLEYIQQADSKDSKTCIDLARSLFVVNRSDGTDSDQRKELWDAEIKYSGEDEDNQSSRPNSIKLSEKKLFFTSAKLAYVAKAKRNGISSEKEESAFKKAWATMQYDDEEYVYKQNHCATSQLSTKKMLDQCETALDCAKKEQDDTKILEICSGIYALEREILQFGEKYASALRANAIISSVDKALSNTNETVDSLLEQNKEEEENIQKDINALQKKIKSEIEDEYNKRSISDNDELPQEDLKKLMLEGDTIKAIVDKAESEIFTVLEKEKILWFETGNLKLEENGDEKIKEKCDKVIESYKKDFGERRKKVLEAKRDDFLETVKNKIRENGDISDKAKEYFLDIKAPNVPELSVGEKDVEKVYKESKHTKGKWIFKREYLDKGELWEKIKDKLLEVLQDLNDNYREEYKKALEKILKKIQSDFETRLDEYSTKMKKLENEKKEMEGLGEKIVEVGNELAECEKELNTVIWSEVK